METAEAEALDYLKSSRLNPESLMQTDGGVIAADSNEVNGDAGPEDLREEEAFRDFIRRHMRKIMKRRKAGTAGHIR